MKRFVILLLLLTLCGCETDKHSKDERPTNAIVESAKAAKKAENESFKQTIAQETEVHKQQQAHYNDVIKHPEKYAEVVDLNTGQVVPDPIPYSGTLPDIANPGSPAFFEIPSSNKKSLNNCPDGKCPLKGK